MIPSPTHSPLASWLHCGIYVVLDLDVHILSPARHTTLHFWGGYRQLFSLGTVIISCLLSCLRSLRPVYVLDGCLMLLVLYSRWALAETGLRARCVTGTRARRGSTKGSRGLADSLSLVRSSGYTPTFSSSHAASTSPTLGLSAAFGSSMARSTSLTSSGTRPPPRKCIAGAPSAYALSS